MGKKTIERWLAEVLPSKETERRADIADRKKDQKVGAQLAAATEKIPETDWRTLSKKDTAHDE